jgi:hypothetical protein
MQEISLTVHQTGGCCDDDTANGNTGPVEGRGPPSRKISGKEGNENVGIGVLPLLKCHGTRRIPSSFTSTTRS